MLLNISKGGLKIENRHMIPTHHRKNRSQEWIDRSKLSSMIAALKGQLGRSDWENRDMGDRENLGMDVAYM